MAGEGIRAGSYRDAAARRQAARERSQHHRDLVAWQQDDDELTMLVATARGFEGLPDGADVPLVLKRNERAYFVIRGASLVQTRDDPGHSRGGYQGFSFRVTKGIRYPAGGYFGPYVQGEEAPKVIGTGVAIITNQRVVFQGAKRAREWAYSKLLGYHHDKKTPWTAVRVSNRQRVSGILYDPASAPDVHFRLALAIADYQGTREQFADQIQHDLAQHEARRPVAPAIRPNDRASEALVMTAASPDAMQPSWSAGALSTYRRFPRWIQWGVPILGVFLIAALASGAGDSKSVVEVGLRGDTTAATAPEVTAAPTTAAPTTVPTTVPPSTTTLPPPAAVAEVGATTGVVVGPASDPAPASAPANNCNSNYNPCVPNDPVDVDCVGVGGDGPSFVRGPVRVIGSDPYDLDTNHDGIGCG